MFIQGVFSRVYVQEWFCCGDSYESISSRQECIYLGALTRESGQDVVGMTTTRVSLLYCEEQKSMWARILLGVFTRVSVFQGENPFFYWGSGRKSIWAKRSRIDDNKSILALL